MTGNVQIRYGWSDTELTEANKLLIPRISEQLLGKRIRILDLGCGNGTLAKALSDMGNEVVAVDASEDGINLAKQRFPGIDFRAVSIYEENFADLIGNDFDAVISMEVIEHLFWPKKLLSAGYAALKPRGQMIVTTPYHGYLKNLALSIAGGWDKHFTVDWDGGHIKFFSRRTLTEFMQESGFHDLSFHGVGRTVGLWKSMVVSGIK